MLNAYTNIFLMMGRRMKSGAMAAFLFLAFSLAARAGVEPYTNSLKGAMKKGDTLVVQDEKFRSALFDWSRIRRQKVSNIISLQVFQDTNRVLPKSFTCEVKLKVEYFSTPDQAEPLSINNVKLKIRFKGDTADINKLTDSYSFENAHWVKVTVEDIRSEEFGNEIPSFLQLTSQIIVDRKYQYSETQQLTPVYNIGGSEAQAQASTDNSAVSSMTVTPGSGSLPHEIKITWANVGSEEYDIEWTTLDRLSGYDDKIAQLQNGSISATDLEEFFRFKSTRVTTHDNEYSVTLTHFNSLMVFRMRTVNYNDDGIRVEGAWDYSNGTPGQYAWFDIEPYWYQSNMNWQFSATYAEEGKKKEVISYFDGTLRNRQTVTINNQDKVAVAQENVYDWYGRVSASIMPAPVIGKNNLDYEAQLNLNWSGNIYSHDDVKLYADCESYPDPLYEFRGASLYYSPHNPLASTSYHKYIPDAEFYPLSVTRYTPDNTGRVKTQGGVGPQFQPGNHTTKYFYGKPQQEELDKLFGNDVGYAEHYLKNMVIDANGQASVSYIDASGKTIATALAGDTPDNVESLPGKPTKQQETKTIIRPQQFQYDFTNLKLSAGVTYLASTIGNATLSFDIEKLIYQYSKPGWTVCSNCFYELTIKVYDDCNQLVTLPVSSLPISIGSQTANCNDNQQYLQDLNVYFPKKGEYKINFEFALSRNAINNYTDEYVKERKLHGDWKTEFEFIFDYAKLEDFTACFSDCRTCEQELGSKPQFIANFKTQLTQRNIAFAAQEAALDTWLDGLYNTLYNQCQASKANCGYSPCDRYKRMMLEDVSPGGQYALFGQANAPLEQEINVLALYWRTVFPVQSPGTGSYNEELIELEDGTMTSPYDASFTLDKLVTYWKPSWAEKFLVYHPEYCKLQFCNNNASYYTWDGQVQEEIKTAAALSTHPATSGTSYSSTNPLFLIAKDPFFNLSTGLGKDYRDDMEADLQNFASRVLKLTSVPDKTINGFVDFMLYCADPGGNVNAGTPGSEWNSCSPVASCRITDREWNLYKEWYFQTKEKYYDLVRKATTCANACEVGEPIGIPPFSGCPAKSDFSVSRVYDESVACPSGQVPVRFQYNKGKVNGTVTLYLGYSADFNGLGLPSTVVLNNGQSSAVICVSEAVPAQSIYISSVACSGASTPDPNACPFGNAGSLTLSGTYQQLAANKFLSINNTTGKKTTYIILSGRQDQVPSDTLCASGSVITKQYYACYRVYLPNTTTPIQYYNVWVVACEQELCTNSFVLNMERQLAPNQFYANGNIYYINSNAPYSDQLCFLSDIYTCLKVNVSNTGTTVNYTDAYFVSCNACAVGNTGSIAASSSSGNAYYASNGTYYVYANTGQNDIMYEDACSNAQRSWFNCLHINVNGVTTTVYNATVFFCPSVSDPCQNAEGFIVQNKVDDYHFYDIYNQTSCSYYKYDYYIFPNQSSSAPPYNYYCSSNSYWGFYDCVKFYANGVEHTYTNAWVLQCSEFITTCGGGGGGCGPYELEPMMRKALVAQSADGRMPICELEQDFRTQKQGGDRYLMSYSDNSLYLVRKDSANAKGKQLKANPGKRKGFTNWEYKDHFYVQVDSARYVNLQKVWIAQLQPGAFRKGAVKGKTDAGSRKGTDTSAASSASRPPGICDAVPCFQASPHFYVSYYSDNCFQGTMYQVHTTGNHTIPSGQTANVSLVINYYPVYDDSNPNGTPCPRVYNGTIYAGQSYVNICVSNDDLVNMESMFVCSNYTPIDDDPPLPTLCPLLLEYKKPRFTTIDYNVPAFDLNAMLGQGMQDLQDQISASCEGMADGWMQALKPCLDARGVAVGSATYNTLRQKLIETCIKGGDLDHPSGASTVPPGRAAQYTSFRQVLTSVLGLGSLDLSCNPWVMESPYPWENKAQPVRLTIDKTSAEICQKLDQLQQQHAASGTGGTFLQYLNNTFGAANVQLSQDDLNDLMKGCTNCRFLLSKEITLPVFLDPASKGCISKAEWDAAVASFNGQFGTTPNPLHGQYADVFSNFMNHRWGFTMTYDQYMEYKDKLVSNPSAILCNEPVYEPVTQSLYQCVNSVLANAITNGLRDYEVYEETEKKIFRMNYVNTCFAAKSNVRLTSYEQTYHYTLYYYDQAGNLVKTVPPSGVQFLTPFEMKKVEEARSLDPANCSYTGPGSNTTPSATLQYLSYTLGSSGNSSIEMWLYNTSSSANQVLAATPDRQFMYQTCLNGNLLNVDIYTIQQTAPDNATFTLSNHVTVDVSSLQPLRPWVHVVVQGSQLSSGLLQVYVNGTLRTAVAGSPSAGCSWQVTAGNPVIFPENLSTLKQLRLYNRMLNASEIAANAKQPCLGLSLAYQSQLLGNLSHWGRFNTPGNDITLADDNSTTETQLTPVYPAHNLPTTYKYNSMGQVVTQNTPDAGTSNFWYDRLGRLVASQNAEQSAPVNGGAPNRYSYTNYDYLGRITEVGEKESIGIIMPQPGFLSEYEKSGFLGTGTNKQITRTFYDLPGAGSGMMTGLPQSNLRKRVSAAVYKSTASGAAEQATYYSYDLAGNVKTLWQQVNGIGLKKIDYQYDLVSGKVNAVGYQTDQPDAFYYQYEYDAENRLIAAMSNTERQPTTDGRIVISSLLTTHTDAVYKYYLHGPLARMELGKNKVQGVDYAYTLQGWLKGINSHQLDPNKDMGEDGKAGTITANNGRDVLAFTLGYYGGDYVPAGGANAQAFNVQFSTPSSGQGAQLFNGNIGHSTLALSKINDGSLTGYTYKYDQLNRIVGTNYHAIGGASGWNNSTGLTNQYNEEYSYDPNGNILALKRAGHHTTNALMDNLTYMYKPGTNQLTQVTDAVLPGVYPDNEVKDLESQPANNYTYDRIGNMIGDSKENIGNISWTIYGKIRSINKTDGSSLLYQYNSSGQRVTKSYTQGGVTTNTYYVRDAQGNTMAVYEGSSRKEQHLYGSSRLGLWKPAQTSGADPSREYELNNHLGNVLATISDKKLPVDVGNNGTIDYYEAEVLMQTDYYPFGMAMTARKFTSENAYRYGFNGKENDNEVKGEGGQQDYGMRIYDPRIAKFLSVDPITSKFPELTPYQFASNTPIQAIDLDGKEAFFIHGTASEPSRWTDAAIKQYLRISGNTKENHSFEWGLRIFNGQPSATKPGNGFFNQVNDRKEAAEKLVDHIFNSGLLDPKEGVVTLVGHSHGGNVAIQAADMLRERLDANEQYKNMKINVITVATPAESTPYADENPREHMGSINYHLHLYNEEDVVQRTLSNVMKRPGAHLPFLRTYRNFNPFSKDFTKNQEIDVSKYYGKHVIATSVGAHSFDTEHPDLLNQVETIKDK